MSLMRKYFLRNVRRSANEIDRWMILRDRSSFISDRSNKLLFPGLIESLKLAAMKTPQLPAIRMCILIAFALAFTDGAPAAIKPTEGEAAKLPEVWEKAGPREQLKAVRAAEIDGDRLLVERIFGLQVDGETTVGDLALEDDAVTGAVEKTLVGAVTVGEPDFLPDGRVELVRAVKIKEVINSLNSVVKGKRLSDGSFVTTSKNAKTSTRTNEKMIDVTGNAALPDTEGHEKVMAKRAAELDAYRRLAGRMMGVKITSDSTVRDMCLENDQVIAALSQLLKAATPTGIKYKSDGTCEVTMEVKVSDVIRTTQRRMKGAAEKVTIKDEIQTNTFTETGIGAMRPAAEGSSEPSEQTVTEKSRGGKDPFYEAEVVVKQVVQSTPVVQ